MLEIENADLEICIFAEMLIWKSAFVRFLCLKLSTRLEHTLGRSYAYSLGSSRVCFPPAPEA